MDPHKQQLSTMDPKLKAAYEQVMKPHTPTTIASPDKKLEATLPNLPKMVTEVQSQTTIHPAAAQPHIANSFSPPSTDHAPSGTIHVGYAKKPTQKFILEKKKSGIHPAVYIVGCIVFFAIYTFFWMKIFGIAIPFLP
jgi:hypothetical protein